jgi:CRP-like cAMP-binding protein
MPDPLVTKLNIAILRDLTLFLDLEATQLDDVLEAARRVKVSRGEFVFFQGDPADRLHLLLEGSLKLTQVTPDGQQVVMKYISPGEAFAVLAVLEGMAYPASAEAVADSQLLAWDREAMNDLMLRYPRIALRVLAIVSAHVHEFQDRLRELSTERVERRIARALLRLANQTGRKTADGILVDLPLSRQDLAEMTGTTLYTVSRTLSHWETQGLVRASREKVFILEAHHLVTIAEDLPPR